MFEVIEDLPAGVVGVETKGKITEADFADVLVPAIEQAKAEHGKVRLLYVIGEDLGGLTVGAAWEDMKLGLRHFTNFERIAIVTDRDWIRNSVRAFGWMIPGEVKLFSVASSDDAREWVGD